MWNKPKISTSKFEKIDLVELSKEEAMESNGGVKVGNCIFVGYYCSTKTYEGGVGAGICMGVGV